MNSFNKRLATYLKFSDDAFDLMNHLVSTDVDLDAVHDISKRIDKNEIKHMHAHARENVIESHLVAITTMMSEFIHRDDCAHNVINNMLCGFGDTCVNHLFRCSIESRDEIVLEYILDNFRNILEEDSIVELMNQNLNVIRGCKFEPEILLKFYMVALFSDCENAIKYFYNLDCNDAIDKIYAPILTGAANSVCAFNSRKHFFPMRQLLKLDIANQKYLCNSKILIYYFRTSTHDQTCNINWEDLFGLFSDKYSQDGEQASLKAAIICALFCSNASYIEAHFESFDFNDAFYSCIFLERMHRHFNSITVDLRDEIKKIDVYIARTAQAHRKYVQAQICQWIMKYNLVHKIQELSDDQDNILYLLTRTTTNANFIKWLPHFDPILLSGQINFYDYFTKSFSGLKRMNYILDYVGADYDTRDKLTKYFDSRSKVCDNVADKHSSAITKIITVSDSTQSKRLFDQYVQQYECITVVDFIKRYLFEVGALDHIGELALFEYVCESDYDMELFNACVVNKYFACACKIFKVDPEHCECESHCIFKWIRC